MTRAASRRLTRLRNSPWLRLLALLALIGGVPVALASIGLFVARLVQ